MRSSQPGRKREREKCPVSDLLLPPCEANSVIHGLSKIIPALGGLASSEKWMKTSSCFGSVSRVMRENDDGERKHRRHWNPHVSLKRLPTLAGFHCDIQTDRMHKHVMLMRSGGGEDGRVGGAGGGGGGGIWELARRHDDCNLWCGN